ncbi:MAG: hypothetical protein ACTHJX_15015 [Terriglobales bacterium]
MSKRNWVLAVLGTAGALRGLGAWAGAGGTGRHQAAAVQTQAAETTPATPATVDHAEYDARMLALANLPPPPPPPKPVPAAKTGKAGRHGRAAAAAVKPPAPVKPRRKPRWPVHGVYPLAGAVLPFHRVVAYYGNFYSTQMGILGQYPESEVLARLQAVEEEWAKADPTTPVMPALDYIAVSAQASPGKDGKYRLRMPDDQLKKALAMANAAHGLLFLDVQPGWSSLHEELPRLEPFMKLPNVELALDPEFALVAGKKPGAWRGTMNAAEINYAVEWLAGIVRANHLAPKILVVHRFTQAMVTGYKDIRPLPEVQVVMDMDGFGLPSNKTEAYHDYLADQPVQFTGFKLFYHNDVKWGKRLMTPAEILGLSPRPIFIVYQ